MYGYYLNCLVFVGEKSGKTSPLKIIVKED